MQISGKRDVVAGADSHAGQSGRELVLLDRFCHTHNTHLPPRRVQDEDVICGRTVSAEFNNVRKKLMNLRRSSSTVHEVSWKP